LAAKYFDHLNIIAGFDELPHKVQVARERCEAIGRIRARWKQARASP